MFQFRCYDNMTYCEKYLNPVQLLKCTHAKSVCIVFDHQQCAAVRINLLLTKVPPQWVSDSPSHCSNSKRDKIPKKKKHFARKVTQSVWNLFHTSKIASFLDAKGQLADLIKRDVLFQSDPTFSIVTNCFFKWPVSFFKVSKLFEYRFVCFLNVS